MKKLTNIQLAALALEGKGNASAIVNHVEGTKQGSDENSVTWYQKQPRGLTLPVVVVPKSGEGIHLCIDL